MSRFWNMFDGLPTESPAPRVPSTVKCPACGQRMSKKTIYTGEYYLCETQSCVMYMASLTRPQWEYVTSGSYKMQQELAKVAKINNDVAEKDIKIEIAEIKRKLLKLELEKVERLAALSDPSSFHPLP